MAKIFSDIVVSIDVGTTKVCTIVARRKNDNTIEIIGVGKSPSHGLRKGIVIDINKTIESIKTSIQEAELVSGYPIELATIGISGSHIRSFNSFGAAPIKHNDVREHDIERVLEAAQAIAVPEGQQILHVLPQYFAIDGQEHILNPRGMAGIRLEAQVHIITGSIASVQNLVSCCQMAGIRVQDIVLEQLASARAVLTPDECELGVGILDIGGGTSDFAIYQNGGIRQTHVVPIAGNHFTGDLAIGLQTTINEAERVKKECGIYQTNSVAQLIAVKKINEENTQLISPSQLAYILQPRAQELFAIIKKEIDKNKLNQFMTTGLVLTGGSSLLSGIESVARDILHIPVRLGIPKTGHFLPESLDNPMYATGYGLLLYAIENRAQTPIDLAKATTFSRMFVHMKSWINDFF